MLLQLQLEANNLLESASHANSQAVYKTANQYMNLCGNKETSNSDEY